ncbi:hypothetical protein SADUNF_Sadunf05G0030600 [Salix dunnii]|uniref:Uncharacterized protein n=1 Tax=Salix dunnii TaxID=1413687 RepID=A0A835K0J7_9ROSI|nr:hypothetical protein SADUNF_Sadunf05G0030600 [Salix dunnii]
MAFSKALPFVAILIAVLPVVALADIDGNLTDFYERLCQEVDCGKGTCVGDISYPLSYKCQCQTGWKQTQYDDDVNDEHKFLPCVIPNCTLNYGSCQPAPPPLAIGCTVEMVHAQTTEDIDTCVHAILVSLIFSTYLTTLAIANVQLDLIAPKLSE